MGNRVRYQVTSNDGDIGPCVYAHWAGDDAEEVLLKTVKQMGDRTGDVAYTTARLIQNMIGNNANSTGFGVWNCVELLTAADAEDKGVYILNCDTMIWKHLE